MRRFRGFGALSRGSLPIEPTGPISTDYYPNRTSLTEPLVGVAPPPIIPAYIQPVPTTLSRTATQTSTLTPVLTRTVEQPAVIAPPPVIYVRPAPPEVPMSLPTTQAPPAPIAQEVPVQRVVEDKAVAILPAPIVRVPILSPPPETPPIRTLPPAEPEPVITITPDTPVTSNPEPTTTVAPPPVIPVAVEDTASRRGMPEGPLPEQAAAPAQAQALRRRHRYYRVRREGGVLVAVEEVNPE